MDVPQRRSPKPPRKSRARALLSSRKVVGQLIFVILLLLSVGAGILGLTFWGIGKVVRPMFPQVSAMTQNYIPDLLIGIAVVLVASQVVESLVSSLGAGA